MDSAFEGEKDYITTFDVNSELCYNTTYGGKGSPLRIRDKIETVSNLLEGVKMHSDKNYTLSLLYGNIQQTYEMTETEKDMLFVYFEETIKEIFLKIPFKYEVYRETFNFLIIPDSIYDIIKICILLKCGIKMHSMCNKLWDVNVSIIIDSIDNINNIYNGFKMNILEDIFKPNVNITIKKKDNYYNNDNEILLYVINKTLCNFDAFYANALFVLLLCGNYCSRDNDVNFKIKDNIKMLKMEMNYDLLISAIRLVERKICDILINKIDRIQNYPYDNFLIRPEYIENQKRKTSFSTSLLEELLEDIV